MKKYFVVLSLFLTSAAYSGSLVCTGAVEQVAYEANDAYVVKLSSMNAPVLFCNPNETWTVAGADGRSMGPETCKAVLSIFNTAKATGQTLSRVHFDGDDVPANCNSFAEQSKVFVRFVNY